MTVREESGLKCFPMTILVPLLLTLGLSDIPEIASGAEEAPQPPNIVLFLADDLGWKDLGCYGNEFHDTPRIDELAARGLRFTSAYANGPNCAPSRASLMTGQYTPRHGITTVSPAARGKARNRRLLVPQTRRALRDEAWTIAEALGTAGYRCASFGKWHLGNSPLEQGFEVNVGGNTKGHPKSYFSPYRNPDLPDGPEGEHLTARLTDEALSFLDAVGEDPFFLYLTYFAVHTPIQGRTDLVEKYRERKGDAKGKFPKPKYAAMVEAIDESVGRVLDHLDERGLDENTIVFFFSDNGGSGGSTTMAPLRGAKGMLYEGGIREPLIATWPGRIPPGGENDEVVLGSDLFPTFCELAGVAVWDRWALDGLSLHPLLFGEGSLRRDAVFWHFPAYLQASGQGEPWRTTPAGAIRAGRYKLIEFFEDGALELYDLEEDLGEERNLAASLPEKRDELHTRLETWRNEVGAVVPTERNPSYVPEGRAEEEEKKPLAEVLLLGDSISIGYTRKVQELLTSRARVSRPMRDATKPENCQYTAYGLERLDDWLGEKKWDLIHFNFGLHDLKYVDGRDPDPRAVSERGEAVLENEHARQIAPLEEYAKNLELLVERLQKTGARLIFATTTPVPENARARRVADAERYNRAAREVMGRHGIVIDDLYGLMQARIALDADPVALQNVADVHFSPEGSSVLAERVARSIGAELQRESDTLDLGSMLRPLPESAVFEDPEWFNWGAEIIRGDDGAYRLFYSRWPRELGFKAWLTNSEIAVATAPTPHGPWTYSHTALRARGRGHWDEITCHNPKIKRFEGEFHLYYTSTRAFADRDRVRNAQCTGIASSSSLDGPWKRLDHPIVEPAPPLFQVAVNPGVTQGPHGLYLLMIKGDREPWSGRMGQRIQAVGYGPTPAGPFDLRLDAAISDLDTEDASLWFDEERRRYYAIFHAHDHLGLITSIDGVYWMPAAHPKVTEKAITREGGDVLLPDRLERPSVYLDPKSGAPRALSCAVKIGETSYTIQIPLEP